MIRPNCKTASSLIAIALAVCGLTQAHAQYSVSPGAAPGGGNIVVGNGQSLGSLISGDGKLSENGNDRLTLNIGSIANDTNSNGATITFFTSGNSVFNFGTINGSESGGGEFASTTGLSFGGTNLTNELVVNNGAIYGGSDGSDDFSVGTAVAFTGNGSMSNIQILNNGWMIGGSFGEAAGTLGSGLAILTENGIYNISGINNGLIAGGAFNEGGDITGVGLGILDYNEGGKDINGVNFTNNWVILGGSFNTSSSNVATNAAVAIVGFGAVSNISFTNSATGSVIGGNFSEDNNIGSDFPTVFAGTGIGIGSMGGYNSDGYSDLSGFTSLNGVSIINAGNIFGGSENSYGLDVGSGVALLATQSISNVYIENDSTGVIMGGSSNGFAVVAGNGINILASSEFNNDFSFFTIDASLRNVSGLTINNGGSILGGNGNSGNTEEPVIYTQALGNGISIGADDTVSNVMINNIGIIAGGNGNDTGYFVGNGLVIFGNNVSGIQINNAGLIAGGNGNFLQTDLSEFFGYFQGDLNAGIALYGFNSLSGVMINNIGTIVGGADLYHGVGGFYSYGGDGIDILANSISNVQINNAGFIGGGFGGGYGIYVNSLEDPNFQINNIGVIAGGNGNPNSEISTNGGYGISFNSPNSANMEVNNLGYISGGNGVNGGVAGYGVYLQTNNSDINNWGWIATGAGSQQHENSNDPNIAIQINGVGNTVNLNGHSAVFGKISASTGEESGFNTVNLNFTGLSPDEIQSLLSTLASQGVGTGTQAESVIFTVRGVNYNIDPAVVNANLKSYQQQGVTPNQQSIGQSLDSAATNPPPGSSLFNLFNAIDNSNVPQALNQLSPQRYEIYGDIALANANFLSMEIDHRLNNLRDGSESIDTSGLGADSTFGTTAGLSKDSSKDGKNVEPEARHPEKRWGFWASGGGLFASIGGHDGNLTDSSFTTGEFLLGVDGKVGDKFVVGLLFNYDHTTANLDNQGGTADVQGYGGAAYAGFHDGPWYANGLAAYSHNAYTSSRIINIPGSGGFIPGFNQTDGANTWGSQYEMNLDGGYDFHITDCVTVGPIAGLQYVHLDVDSFQEFGAGAADLAVGGQSVDSLRSRLGVRADYHKQIAKEVAFAAEVRAEYQHEFLDGSYGITSSFIGTGLTPFSTRTTSPERDAAVLGVGVNFTVRDRMTIFVDYDVQCGQQNYLENSVKGGLKFSF